jgi:hypothetical protein
MVWHELREVISGVGQSLRFDLLAITSGVPPRTDIAGPCPDFRKGPNPDIGSGASHNILSGYDAFPEFGRGMKRREIITLLSGAAMRTSELTRACHADFL